MNDRLEDKTATFNGLKDFSLYNVKPIEYPTALAQLNKARESDYLDREEEFWEDLNAD
jgi:hypothetical protein